MVSISKSIMSLLVVLLSNTATANPIGVTDIVDGMKDTFASVKIELTKFKCSYNYAWDKRFELQAWDRTGKLSMSVSATEPDSDGIVTFMLSENAAVPGQRFGVNREFELHTIHPVDQLLDKKVSMQMINTTEVGKLVVDSEAPRNNLSIVSLPTIRFEPPGKTQSLVYEFTGKELASVLILRIDENEPFVRCSRGNTHYIKRISVDAIPGHKCMPITLGIVGEMVGEVYAALNLKINLQTLSI